MRQIIFTYVIQQLLYFTSKVESLKGSKIMNARDGEFPFIGSLQHYPDGQHYCTGALVTKQHVITAAHCLDKETPAEIRIAFGIAKLQSGIANYTVASWQTYDSWANSLNIQKEPFPHDIAIVELTNIVSQPNIIPVRLNEFRKKQIQGKVATVIGWKNITDDEKVLRKGFLKILSDEDCERHIRLIINHLVVSTPAILCTIASPYVLLEDGDSGGPVVDGSNSLLGVSRGFSPELQYAWGHFPHKFLHQYQVNIHFSVDYYRNFIANVTGYN